jgi:ubiquitin C-terminal hydrolase
LSSLNIDSKEIYYDCVAMVCHIGKTLTCGHYVAYNIENDQWMLYNDLTRQTVNVSEVQSKTSQNSFLLI